MTSNHRTVSGHLDVETIRLAAREFCVSQCMDPRMLDGGRFEAFARECGREMVLQFRKAVASRVYDVKTVRFPADWRQALKERFVPQWVRRRWPVKYTEVTLEADAYYPTLRLEGHEVFVRVMERVREYEEGRP